MSPTQRPPRSGRPCQSTGIVGEAYECACGVPDAAKMRLKNVRKKIDDIIDGMLAMLYHRFACHGFACR